MDVELPNGRILEGVPDGTSQQDIIAKVMKFDPAMGREMLNATVTTMAQPPEVGGAFDAAMIGGGRAAERLWRGAKDLSARATGDDAAREKIAAQEAESSTLYQPVREQHPIASAVGESLPYFAVPMGAAAGTAGRALSAVPKLAKAGGILGRSAIADAALVGAGMGALDTEGTAAGGAAGGLLGGAAGSLGGRLIRPVVNKAGEGVQAALETAKKLGIRPSAAEQTGSRALRGVEGTLRANPFSAGAFRALDETNQAQMNRVAAESIGEVADEISGPVLARAARRIGDTFESVADEPSIALGDDFLNALVKVEKEFGESWTESPAAKRAIEKALDLASEQTITGRAALDATQRLGKDARRLYSGQNADPVAAEALSTIKEALDDAIVASVSPAKAEALQTARAQWRNLLTLERPGVIPGAPAIGDISAAALGNQLRGASAGKGFIRGQRSDPLGELGAIGKAFPKPTGGSPTAERMALPLMLGTGAAAGAFSSPEDALLGAAIAPAAMALAGRGYASPLATSYLRGGLLPLTEAGRAMLTGAGGRIGGALLPKGSDR